LKNPARFGRPPTADELRAVSRKYEALAALRRDYQREGKTGERSSLRALAREFPGVLRELDRLPLDQIEERAKLLAGAAEGLVSPEPWMAWMVAYHAAMRAALFVRASTAPAQLGAKKPFDASAARTIAVKASESSGILVDNAFVCAVVRPPGGRLNRAVFDRLGHEFGVPPDELWEALFPARRPGRYVKRPRR
jgi:hypothetical protein